MRMSDWSSDVCASELFSEQKVRDIGPIPGTVVRVVWLAAAWIVVQLLIGLAGLGGGPHIAIAAHIAGFLVGLALTRPLLLWRYRGACGGERAKPRHRAPLAEPTPNPSCREGRNISLSLRVIPVPAGGGGGQIGRAHV